MEIEKWNAFKYDMHLFKKLFKYDGKLHFYMTMENDGERNVKGIHKITLRNGYKST
jgi:hypothetical protein